MRGMIRFSPVRLGMFGLAVFAMVLAVGASAATAVTIGQTSANADFNCGYGFFPFIAEYDLQTGVASGPAFVVPAGSWVITSWSTYAGTPYPPHEAPPGDGGFMSMVVFRPTTVPDSYTVVGESPIEQLTASVLNTFSANVQVQGGDLLGFWAGGGAACATHTGAAGDVDFSFPAGNPPPVGSTVPGSTPYPTPLFRCSRGCWTTSLPRSPRASCRLPPRRRVRLRTVLAGTTPT